MVNSSRVIAEEKYSGLHLRVIPRPEDNYQKGSLAINLIPLREEDVDEYAVPLQDHYDIWDLDLYRELKSSKYSCSVCSGSDPDIGFLDRDAGLVLHEDCMNDLRDLVLTFIDDHSALILQNMA